MSGLPKMEISHVGINVTDIKKMTEFYTTVLGYTVTDGGAFQGGEMVFMSRNARDHHQIVLGTGRPEGSYSTINQISFKLDGLPALRQARQVLLDAGMSEDDLDPACHGNAWSVYFRDPEGNRLEFFTDTPWYVAQPHRAVLDFSKSDEEIHALTQSRIEGEDSFEPFDQWRSKISKELEPVD